MASILSRPQCVKYLAIHIIYIIDFDFSTTAILMIYMTYMYHNK